MYTTGQNRPRPMGHSNIQNTRTPPMNNSKTMKKR